MYTLTADAEVEVPFHDVDAMEVAWHGHYLKYFELGRCALLRRIDYDYPQMIATGHVWPVVECHLKYVRSAVYGQRLHVQAQLLEHENRLKIGYLISDAATGQKLTKGHTIQVAVDTATREMLFASPPVLIAKLERACRTPN